jgi:ABC-type transport system involved in multi-copper enzyme maturation permease subunit
MSENGLEHLKEDLWGIYHIAKREFWANIRSIRSVVMVLILALIMVGGAMGFTQPASSNDREEGFIYHQVAADPDGKLDDLVVYVYFTDTFAPIEGRQVTLLMESMYKPEYAALTDDMGFFVAKNLTPAFHLLDVDIRVDGGGGGFGPGMGVEFTDDANKATPIFFPPNLTIEPTLSIIAIPSDINDDDRVNDIMVQIVGPDGRPEVGATVDVDGETVTTDEYGISKFTRLSKGNHTITASAQGDLSAIAIVNVSGAATETDPFALASADPDMVLNIIASIAMGIFGPIYAIVLCFDTVFREKLTGSIDYLLSRPMGRRAVIVGKFTGIMAALMIPIAAVSLIGIAVIGLESPQSPTLSVVGGFLLYSTLLIGFFALLQIVFSTLAKTTGTAVLSGVGIWLMFSLLFNIIMIVVAVIKGMDFGSDEFNDWSIKVSLMNPIQLYGMAMGVLVGGDLGVIPNWSPAAILIIVTIAMFLLTMEIFRRKATE